VQNVADPLRIPSCVKPVFSEAAQTPQALDVAILTETDRHMAVLDGILGSLGYPGGDLFHDIHTAA
jgi:hypothetical protein